ncbi:MULTISPECIES: DUF3037 domain-containing protein [Aggregatibacter]|jgi:hypothetical protein|uniref:Protein of uncharacterized function (DUF3037) n=1 Tax=Aggregatibacter aphrophilus ATCC 33389 TaxID=985008 RepID=A0A448FAR6_AGGAP|nr:MULTISPECIES: DUF3037 domain-containing protein [Aggregatibacter]KNE85448.1 hypothetical protein ATCC33389_0205985 [Aggregatibacter aphrophilus ATCC 33389]MDU7786105.1 DUF3037 domain-containing protein [Aggregatibacter aphrophilus]OBY54416.1 hypothetical protein BBB51_04655 [Aggregatibacter aphrophilus]PNL93271.1 DUF3037 domain-containing protein [Aggregatibacter aphrophilus]RDE88986.1 DUF3037 domain-containing protein [Aggregatibacter aphrophilus]
MKTPILYSFVRFLPFFESGEFVNIGLLMCEPNRKKLTYRLVKRNDPRVNHFFRNSKIFYDVQPIIDEQLKYIVDRISVDTFNTNEEIINFFHSYTEQRDGLFQFSNAAVALVDNPMMKFDEIYERFIRSACVPSENQENRMIKHYREMFKNDQVLSLYKSHLVQGGTAKFTLPLAIKDGNTPYILKGIKPLAFDQSESASMIEHCDSWVAKINRASDEGLISKDKVLFTLDTANSKKELKILKTIKDTFDKFGIYHTDWKDNFHILSFARNIKVF